MADYRIHEALAASMDLARAANVYVEDRQPWAQAKDPNAAQELDETLATLVRVLCVLCALLEPVVPGKMAELALRLGLDTLPSLETSLTVNLAGNRLEVSDPLFPRIEPSWAEDLG
jgi:methionyl-tRNA synthetase